MRTEVIEADTIEEAAQQILNELKRDVNGASRRTSRRENVIYFDGWDGLGASAVLRTVAERLDPATRDSEVLASELYFDQIIHIDCSKWENRRVLQRKIAKHLQLPTEVMEIFDWQDEEDDIHGVAQGSRLEIPQILRAMFQRIKELNHRFLVVFHNGSSEKIDLSSFGFPLSGYLDNMVLWTFQGRFRLYPRMKVGSALHNSTGTAKTDIFFSASYLDLEGRDPQELWSVLVHRETAEFAKNIRIHTVQVAECCFLHMLKLCCMGHSFKTDYDLATHACNYWMCEGIMQQLQQGALGDTSIVDTDDDEESWRTADALQQEIQLDMDYYNYKLQYFPPHLERHGKTVPCLTSPYGFMLVPVPVGGIPNVDILLQDFDNLTVLKLSGRTFSFSSPPFLYYHNLKFLWLDHCEDQEVSSTAGFPDEEKKKKISTDRALKEADIQRQHRFYQKLWVLDVRYTCCDWILSAQMMDLMTQLRELNVMGAQDWDMGLLHGRLPNIRKLRVTKSSICCSSCLESYLFSKMDKMELLDLSGNNISPLVMSFSAGPVGSNITTSNVVTVIINDGFVGLREISLRGCSNLKNLFLRGVLQDLCSMDISGTAVKTLDLSAMMAPNLDELYLLGCDKLCAILWPAQDKRKKYLNKLHIDTNTQLGLTLTTPSGGDENNKEGSTSPSSSSSMLPGGKAPHEFEWYISVRDARFLFSLAPMRSYFDNYRAHVDISSPTHHLLEAREGGGDDDAPTIITEETIWPCPDAPSDGRVKCYMNIDTTKIRANRSPLGSVEETMTRDIIAMPDFICDGALSLHVHDALSMAIIPAGTGPEPGAVVGAWNDLLWCRVERCPNFDSVFTTPPQVAVRKTGIFQRLHTFWGSQLPKVRFIWNWGKAPSSLLQPNSWPPNSWSFLGLQFLHLDLCPRLIHVLPLPKDVQIHCLRNIVTLEIVWCSGLKVIFPIYSGAESSDEQQKSNYEVNFYNLEHIHLHELPRLRHICGVNARWYAPKLKTIKIRGCWSLRRLPALSEVRGGKVTCDCKKEWWDNLEWDGSRWWHNPSRYQPTHPRYYKKRMLRGRVLV